MTTPYKPLEIKLTQHTPIIHFQHDQSGATLRATEVKPKLDAFLIRKLGGLDQIPGSWRIKDTKALNYKLRFSSAESHTVELGLRTDYDIYYGNMGSDTLHVKGIVEDSDVKMTLLCFIPELLSELRACLPQFFLCTNFGRMQSKGFGSYMVKDYRPSKKEVSTILCHNYQAATCYTFAGGNTPFKRIKTIYSLIKSGLDFPHTKQYRYSLLFQYLAEHGYGNEKDGLKLKGMAPKTGNILTQNLTSFYVRALLGTADHFDFRVKDRKEPYRVNVSNEEIARFPSTIFFKVIDRTVYYIGKPISPEIEIFKQPFIFTSDYNDGTPETFYTPEKNDFIHEGFVTDFLKYCMTELNDPDPAYGETAMVDFPGMRNVVIEEVTPNVI